MAAEAGRKADEMAKRMEEAHAKTVAEVASLSTKTDGAFSLANEVSAMLKGIASRLSTLTEWEIIIITLAIGAAVIMLTVGIGFLGQ
ncbi:hypothetical protein ACFLWC_07350 [Chloroflexota bacterium]